MATMKNGLPCPRPEEVTSWKHLVSMGSEATDVFSHEHPQRAEFLKDAFYRSHGVSPAQPKPIVPPIPVPGK
jgi:hypothetical protein